MKIGPKSNEEKEAIIKEIQNLIITGEIHEKTITENAEKLKISRITFREYVPVAYDGLDVSPELIVKRVKDTRQFLIDTLLRDFKRCDDAIQRNTLSKNISGLLDSQEKSATLIIQSKEEKENEGHITSGTNFWEKYLSKIPHRPVEEEESECHIPSS